MENDMKLAAGEALSKENSNKDSTSCTHEEERGGGASLLSEPHGENREDDESSLNLSHSSAVGTPFASLSQVDADLVLARTLQDQERTYLMIKMQNEAIDSRSWEDGNYLLDEEADAADKYVDGSYESEDEEDEDDDGDKNSLTHVCGDQYSASDDDNSYVRATRDSAGDQDLNADLDPGVFSSDESYARALQDVEEREMTARMLAMAAINDGETGYQEDYDDNSQDDDAWEEVDPDELSYEELLALGEIVGTEGKGLSAAKIASLPSINYKKNHDETESCDSCVICCLDYEDAEALTLLFCKHSYHSDCINNWLKINKVCPVCSAEVSTSGSS